MTPLAQAIVRDQVEAKAYLHLPELMSSDCRCFEVSAVVPMMKQLVESEEWDVKQERLAFLPAPYTWIEWQQLMDTPDGFLCTDPQGERPPFNTRCGFMLTAFAAGDRVKLGARGAMVMPEDGFIFNSALIFAPGRIMFGPVIAMTKEPGGGVGLVMPQDIDETSEVTIAMQARMVASGLAIINAPRIIGRRTHLPHAGLQRAIAKSRKMVGKFPLQAWTEIVLEITPPQEAQDDGHEAHLTGGRALHFCRAHLRIRLGQLEFVRHHWRGDPSIGIKRSRYVVKPPRPSQPRAA